MHRQTRNTGGFTHLLAVHFRADEVAVHQLEQSFIWFR
jgi:hypothetical protein